MDIERQDRSMHPIMYNCVYTIFKYRKLIVLNVNGVAEQIFWLFFVNFCFLFASK